MSRLLVRKVRREEFSTAIEWAAAEGWNPGLGDLDVFHAADPGGFLMGFLDGAPICSISVVRYGEDFGFLGFYLVHPDHRGRGYGIAIWREGLKYLQGRNVGLDGVVDQQANYRRSGFVYYGRNIRYSGTPATPGTGPRDLQIRTAETEDLALVSAMDRTVFAADRTDFLQCWMLAGAPAQRHSLVAREAGRLKGFGTIRKCRSGWKIGPLTASDPPSAAALFGALCALAPAGDEVTLDVPEANGHATELAQSAGLSPVFETARMYLATPPPIRHQCQYGITSFELG